MKTTYFWALILLFFGIVSCSSTRNATDKKQEATVGIQFSKNVELFGYLIHLAEPEGNDPEHPISQILAQGAEDINIPAVSGIYELGGSLPYSFFVELLYTLPEFPLPERYTFPSALLQKYGMDSAEEVASMKELVKQLQLFYEASHFEQIWTDMEPHRTSTLALLRRNQPSGELFTEIEQFYQQSFSAYQIVPSLTVWSGPGWGPTIQRGEEQVATFILGPLAPNYDYSEGARFENLAIHEFGHSFVNHIVLSVGTEEIAATQELFEPLREAMFPQGYENWETCVIEHFVRAGEVLIPETMGDTTASQALLQDYTEQRSFVYLPFIINQLRTYRLEQNLSYEEAVKKTLIDLQAANL